MRFGLQDLAKRCSFWLVKCHGSSISHKFEKKEYQSETTNPREILLMSFHFSTILPFIFSKFHLVDESLLVWVTVQAFPFSRFDLPKCEYQPSNGAHMEWIERSHWFTINLSRSSGGETTSWTCAWHVFGRWYRTEQVGSMWIHSTPTYREHVKSGGTIRFFVPREHIWQASQLGRKWRLHWWRIAPRE